eukprot:UN3071
MVLQPTVRPTDVNVFVAAIGKDQYDIAGLVTAAEASGEFQALYESVDKQQLTGMTDTAVRNFAAFDPQIKALEDIRDRAIEILNYARIVFKHSMIKYLTSDSGVRKPAKFYDLVKNRKGAIDEASRREDAARAVAAAEAAREAEASRGLLSRILG